MESCGSLFPPSEGNWSGSSVYGGCREPSVDSTIPKSSRTVKDFVVTTLGEQGNNNPSLSHLQCRGRSHLGESPKHCVDSPHLCSHFSSLSRETDATPSAPVPGRQFQVTERDCESSSRKCKRLQFTQEAPKSSWKLQNFGSLCFSH